ncbi:glycosyltransferase [Methanonatronarchaeum sp. AMET6-2]|uniref:glycosyltransferase n=1 Tax=Methanonatronarchaeum sp. AMET6-2 TaxID=2933293 RepID=UPI0011FC4F91|nr:glycosyltransferase [Methanonatronarchaeum sp. AMET6-2]RZN62926.1 MAG: glycosyltransferase family 4 protein [Methanonatronarchaeia archaeon]UOY09859.1 glycosyltransferase [Methanonatronarchaeum sp. AMET6-2]
MNIALFTDSYFPQINGVTYSISLLKRKLVEMGHNVKVVFPESNNYSSGQNEIGIKSFPLPFYDGYRLGFPESISRKLGDVDVIHTHTQFSLGGFGAYIARKKDAVHVNTVHTCPEHYVNYITNLNPIKNFLKYIYNCWETRFLNSAKTVTVPTPEIKKVIENKGVDNVKVVPNGVDLDFFGPKEKNFTDFDGPIIGYSGRHSKEKNIEDIIRVAERLENYKVIIVGEGPYREHYEELAKDLDNVIFYDFMEREKLPYFYSTLDAFVFPSIAETHGLVALEANACGTPVIGANENGLKNSIIDGVNGYHYTPNNIDMLERKIRICVDRKGDLKNECISYAEKYSIDKITNELIRVYGK